MKDMNVTDPRLRKLAITLKDVLKESETREIQTNDNTVLNLWPSYTLEEVLKNPLFYEKPITQVLMIELIMVKLLFIRTWCLQLVKFSTESFQKLIFL